MKRPAVVIACGALIVTLAMGVRQTFGLFLPDMSAALDIGRGTFGLALALQNLLFGLAQRQFRGAQPDRFAAGGGLRFFVIQAGNPGLHHLAIVLPVKFSLVFPGHVGVFPADQFRRLRSAGIAGK